MAVSPGTYNISLQRRADYYVTLQFKDSAGTVIDLTGWTVAAQAWNRSRTTKYLDFTVEYTNRPTGTVTLRLTDAQTEALPLVQRDEVYYDVLLTDTAGLKEYYLEGVIYVFEGYTT